jgi:hypothetical protein
MTEPPFQNWDGIFPQANPCVLSSRWIARAKLLLTSHLSLCSNSWHGHCNTGPGHNLFFESEADARRILREREKEMKPRVKQNNFSKRAEVAQKSAFPLIDCNYQTVALPSYRGSCLRPRCSSFRNISGEYFRNEARNEFRVEAAAFVAIVITAAISILNNMHTLADFLRATSSL